MASTLLRTKFYIPPVRSNLVLRPHLYQYLGMGGQVTVVSAPAGFGKTTLVAEWVKQRKEAAHAVGWLSLDEYDNELGRFLSYVVAALQRVLPDLSQRIPNILQSAPSALQVLPLMTALVNEIISSEVEFSLVLDDYHLISAPTIHQALIFLLDHLPPLMHLVIISRTDLPFPLSRWRVRGQLSEIRAADLRFTVEQTGTFLNHLMRLNLTTEQITMLEASTEGWVAGLQLAALSMQRRADRAAFIKTFSGSDRYVVDYLLEEVFEQQSVEIQQFLLKTAVLDRFSAPLCDALLTSSEALPPYNSQAILERLEGSNLLLIPLDDKRQWYRYHNLFSQFLRARLQQSQPHLLTLLYQRALAWYAAQNQMPDAIQLALKAKEFSEAARLMSQVGWGMIVRGDLMTIRNWLNALPHELIGSDARLAILDAYLLISTGNHQAAQQRVEEIEAEEDSEILGHLASLQAQLASKRGELQETINFSNESIRLLPKEKMMRVFAAWNVAYAYWQNGQLEEAEQAYQQALQLVEGVNIVIYRILAEYGQMCISQGRLRQAKPLFLRALQLGQASGARKLPLFEAIYNQLARLSLQWNQLAQAEEYLQEAMQLAQLWGITECLLQNLLLEAEIKQAQGALEAAQQAIERTRQLLDEANWPRFSNRLIERQASLALAKGELSSAQEQLAATSEQSDALQLIRVRLLLAQSQPDKALALLSLLAQKTGTSIWHIMQSLALQALAYQQQRKKAQALASLKQAITLAEPEGYLRPLIDIGPSLEPILRQLAATTAVTPYLAQLLAALHVQPQPSLPAAPTLNDNTLMPTLVEPLSNRELEVLRLIAAGFSNRETAETLVITVSTVKNHLRTIYSKLNVRRRTQAIAKANELG